MLDKIQMETSPDQTPAPTHKERMENVARPLVRRRRRSMDILTIGEITSRNQRIYYQSIIGLSLLLLVCMVFVSIKDEELIWPCLVISATSLVPLWIWVSQAEKGIPILPAFSIQQLLIYLIPIFTQNPTIQGYDSTVMNSSAMSIGLLFILLPLGWMLGRELVKSYPSRWNLDFKSWGTAGAFTLRIAVTFLLVSIAFEIFLKLGLMQWIPTGLMPVFKVVLASMAAFGAFLGGFVIADRRHTGSKTLFWSAFYLLFLLSTSGLLLSGVTLMVVAAGIGLGLGGGRTPWRFVIAISAILSFLNVGKFDMRAKYWGEGGANMSLLSTPKLYADWTKFSLDKLVNRSATARSSFDTVEIKGQSLLERINSIQNMTFVINAQQVLHKEPLWGKTYKLIPPLFIPRFLWPEKPRTHEGQIMLNLHYDRQSSVEDTKITYIAWGFLPEAVGNFGPLGGAVFLGLVMGLLLGILESWSVKKRLFSIEGIVIVGLLLQILISFEMVASVFLTSTFQMVVVLVVGGALFRIGLASEIRKFKRRQ